jgi:3-phenylpropionate/cinnamic acid dioxygenase small subunit
LAITSEDRAAITEVIARHGHLIDSGELDRLDEVFTADVTYDMTDFGQRPPGGWGEVSPVGHHVTNAILTEAADGTVQARSKGIGVNADCTCNRVTYEDDVVRGDQGWQISQRKILARRTPLGGKLNS